MFKLFSKYKENWKSSSDLKKKLIAHRSEKRIFMLLYSLTSLKNFSKYNAIYYIKKEKLNSDR